MFKDYAPNELNSLRKYLEGEIAHKNLSNKILSCYHLQVSKDYKIRLREEFLSFFKQNKEKSFMVLIDNEGLRILFCKVYHHLQSDSLVNEVVQVYGKQPQKVLVDIDEIYLWADSNEEEREFRDFILLLLQKLHSTYPMVQVNESGETYRKKLDDSLGVIKECAVSLPSGLNLAMQDEYKAQLASIVEKWEIHTNQVLWKRYVLELSDDEMRRCANWLRLEWKHSPKSEKQKWNDFKKVFSTLQKNREKGTTILPSPAKVWKDAKLRGTYTLHAYIDLEVPFVERIKMWARSQNLRLWRLIYGLTNNEQIKLRKFIGVWVKERLEEKLLFILEQIIEGVPRKRLIHFAEKEWKGKDSEKQFKSLETTLASKVERFYVNLQLEEEATKREILLLTTFRERGELTLFELIEDRIRNRLKEDLRKDAAYFQYVYEVEWERLAFISTYYPRKIKELAENNTELLLDKWVWMEKLIYAVSKHIRKQILGEKNIPSQEGEPLSPDYLIPIQEVYKLLKQHTEKSSEDERIVWRVWEGLYEVFEERSTGDTERTPQEQKKLDDKVYKLEELIKNHEYLFTAKRLQEVYSTIISYYAKRRQADNSLHFIKRIHQLYEWGFQPDGWLMKMKYVSYSHIKNYLTCHDRLGKLEVSGADWMNNKVVEKSQRDILRFLNICILFKQEAYRQVEEATELYRSFGNSSYKIEVRIFGLKATYLRALQEGRELTNYVTKARSLLSYVKNQQIGKYHKDAYMAFANVFIQLVNHHSNYDKTIGLEKLIKQIEERNIAHKEWLLSQLGNLKM